MEKRDDHTKEPGEEIVEELKIIFRKLKIEYPLQYIEEAYHAVFRR